MQVCVWGCVYPCIYVCIPLIRAVKVEPPLEGRVRGFDGGELLELHERSVHPVLPVAQLDQVAVGVPDRSVVGDDDTLHGLHETTLDVP